MNKIWQPAVVMAIGSSICIALSRISWTFAEAHDNAWVYAFSAMSGILGIVIAITCTAYIVMTLVEADYTE